jgi:hypothetical protein
MASMRNGEGDDYFIVFSPSGAYARGFDHESPMSPYRLIPPAPWPGVFDAVPEAFRAHVTQLAFGDHEGNPLATVCFWREQNDAEWKCGPVEPLADGSEDDGGAGWLFGVLLDGKPEAYQKFAEDYYEVAADIGAIRHVYALRPLTQAIVSALNPDTSLSALEADIAEIGYPSPAS